MHPDNPYANRLMALVPWGDGRVYWDFGNATAGRLHYLPPVPLLDAWHHFAFVARAGAGGYQRIYRNGVLEAERTGTIPTFNPALADELRLGQLQLPEGLFTVDGEIRLPVLDRGAQRRRDRRDYNRRLGGTEAGLVIYHRLDEPSGPIVGNAIGVAFSGVLRNGALRLASTAPVEVALPREAVAEDLASGLPRLTGQVKPGA